MRAFMRGIAVGFLALSTPALADEVPVQFLPEIPDSCGNTLGLSTQCIGIAANACMHASGDLGNPHVTKACLSKETQYWDNKLNRAYQELMAEFERIETEEGRSLLGTPDTLRAMQRNWIALRDSRCEFEYAQDTGGSGGLGSSTIIIYKCQMEATGEQALYLEKRLMQAMMW